MRKFGKCEVCDTPITEERYWHALSHRGVAPETCSVAHQTLLRQRRYRADKAAGKPTNGRRKRDS